MYSMTLETLDLIHRNYVLAVEKSNNILGIIRNLNQLLSECTVCAEDTLQFDAFVSSLERAIKKREKTFELTNLATDILFVNMYIIIWLNSTKSMHIDINLNARRKALESELTKLLKRSIANNSPRIYDRFGLRGNILNNVSKLEAIEILYEVVNYTISILGKRNRKVTSEFMNWINTQNNIDDFTKERINFILSLPFVIEEGKKIDTDFDPKEHQDVIIPKSPNIWYPNLVKDYIISPKPSGYQSLHFVLALDEFSPILPGSHFEFQFRTHYMHQIASKGSAAHAKYEDEKSKDTTTDIDLREIFFIKDFSKVNIVGFTGYDSIDDDIDGVHFAKVLVNRRISSSLV